LRPLLQATLAFVALIGLGTAVPLPIHAQTNSASADLPANRYLLIVETSRSMQRRSEGTVRAVSNLIGSRMRGQLRLNDTIGVWTFNDTLYTGKLALQDWSEGERSAIAGKIVSFLEEQPYEKQGQLDKVLPALLRVVKNSEFITVILISEGAQDFQGTPFDQQINLSYKQWSAQQQQAHMPFVTVLRARRGQFTNYSVTPAPWPVDMPPLPVDLVRPKTPPGPPVASARRPDPPPMAPPLIISGKKPEPAPVVATNSVVGQQTLAPAAASQPVTQVAQNKTQPEASSTSSAPAPVPGQSSLASAPPTAPAIIQPPPVAQTPLTNGESQAAARLVQESVPAAAPPVTPALETKPASDGPPPNPPASKPDRPAGAQDSSSTPPQVAAAPVAPGSSPAKLIAIALVIAASAAIAGLWLWKRRARPASHVSLITRSLDRDKH
jgi:hypothetical protein